LQGPPSVITSENIDDWLKDRWQAAKDLTGVPIPGEHWVEVDLGRPSYMSRFIIDWETGFSQDYAVFGRLNSDSEHQLVQLADSKQAKVIGSRKQHLIHEIAISSGAVRSRQYQHIRLLIRKPATQWGVSIWRFQVYGRD
jgi:allantoicase